MSATTASRTLLRRPNLRFVRQTKVRYNSTTEKASEAASNASSKAKETAADASSKAKESASNFQSKASEGLSKVTSSAGVYAKSAGNALGKIGGRTGKVIKAVESAIPPTIYYSKVGLEMSKLVFHGQKMSLPSAQTFQSYFQPVINVAKNPASILKTAPTSGSNTPEAILSRIRNIDRAQMVTGGVVFAEVLGFFTIGEMIGRWKIVGYKGEVHHEH